MKSISDILKSLFRKIRGQTNKMPTTLEIKDDQIDQNLALDMDYNHPLIYEDNATAMKDAPPALQNQPKAS